MPSEWNFLFFRKELLFLPNINQRIFSMVKVKDILREIEHYAPLPLQEGFDNAGVQVGDVNQHATGVLLCLDAVSYTHLDVYKRQRLEYLLIMEVLKP